MPPCPQPLAQAMCVATMAVYYTPLPWSVCLTEHEHSLLSCFGQMSLLQMAYFDLLPQTNDEVRPQRVAILHAIVTAGQNGLHWVVCLRHELATMEQRHVGGTLLGWADSAGLDLHMMFSQSVMAAWRDLQAMCGLDLFPSDSPPLPSTPPHLPPPSIGDAMWELEVDDEGYIAYESKGKAKITSFYICKNTRLELAADISSWSSAESTPGCSSGRPSAESLPRCSICLSNNPTFECMPCHHCCICSNCCDGFHYARCPICRCVVTSVDEVYFS